MWGRERRCGVWGALAPPWGMFPRRVTIWKTPRHCHVGAGEAVRSVEGACAALGHVPPPCDNMENHVMFQQGFSRPDPRAAQAPSPRAAPPPPLRNAHWFLSVHDIIKRIKIR